MKKYTGSKRKGIARYVAGILVSLFLGGLQAQAATYVCWDNGGAGQDWNTPTNWVGDAAPVEGVRACINLAGADRAIYSSGTSPNYDAVRVGTNAAVGEVEMTGGTLYAYKKSGVACEVGAGGTGVMNQSGGLAKFCMLRIGKYAGASGIYTLTGGELIINRDTYDSMRIGDAGTGTFMISGGSLSTDGLVVLGYSGGSGMFHVVGSGATSISVGGEGGTGNDDGKWQQNSGSTLKVGIDTNGVTKISVEDAGDIDSENNGNVVFASGALLDVGFTNGYTATEGSWDIMQWDGVLINSGLKLSANVTDPMWNFQFVDTGGTNGVDTLRVIYGDVSPVETTNGTPYAWLDGFYPGLESPEEYQAADDGDSDGDLQPTWKEYIAGTIPTDRASVLKMSAADALGDDYVITWQSVTGKYYSVLSDTNLVGSSRDWKTDANHIRGLENETSYTTTVGSASAQFYKVGIEKREIYLLIGQSNMAGRGPMEAGDMGEIEGCELFNFSTEWEPATNPLNKYSTIRKDLDMQQLNPGYGFALRMHEVRPEINLGLIVNARGGTGINEWAKGTTYYNEAVARVQAALAQGDSRLGGILWHQGESNSSHTNTYMGKLTALIADLRADLGDPDLPFVAGQLERDDTTPEVEDRPINDYIILLPTMVSNTAVATTEGLITLDGIHFDSAGQRELGRRYADALLSLE